MNDLLIKIRLEALKNNLEKTQSIVESVLARRAEIDALSNDIKKAGNHVDTIVAGAKQLKDETKALTFGDPRVHPELAHVVEALLGAGTQLRELLQAFRTNIDTVTTRRAPIEKVERTVAQDLEESTREWNEKIRDSLESLKKAQGTEAADRALNDAWATYTKIMSQQMRNFFSDYVEFLGGLALRDAGLDEGICRIADELIISCGSIGRTDWNALTIPANEDAITLARTIRMGFPEWTIWAVPLAARELGQLAMQGSKDWNDYVSRRFPNKRSDRARNHMRVCLADAFATYAMGPAYACAAILLRFNPPSTYVDKDDKYPSDAKRAHVVLTTLKTMGTLDKDYNPSYIKTGELLEQAWQRALERAKPSGTLNRAELEEWSNYMLRELQQSRTKGLYEGRRLESTIAALRAKIGGDTGPELAGDEEGRDVLNAAWELRLENKYSLLKIEEHAQSLWDHIAAEKRKREDQQAKANQSFRPRLSVISPPKGSKHG